MKTIFKWGLRLVAGISLLFATLIAVEVITTIFVNRSIDRKLAKADMVTVVGIGENYEEYLLRNYDSEADIEILRQNIHVSSSFGCFLPLRCMCHGSVSIILYLDGKEFERWGILHKASLVSEFGDKFSTSIYNLSGPTIDYFNSLIPEDLYWDGYLVKLKTDQTSAVNGRTPSDSH